MISLRLRAFSVLLGVAVLSTSTAANSRPRTYAIVDLGTLPGGQSSQANDINDRAQVVGTSLVNGAFQPFLWQNGVMMPLPLLPGATGGSANAINEQGAIVGSNAVEGVSRAVMWLRGRVIDLGQLPDSYSCAANAINDRAQVVGTCELTTFGPGAFLWENGRMRLIGGLPGGDFTFPTGINNIGAVVGVASNSEFQFRAFAWWRGIIVDLGTLPGGLTSSARIVNNRGMVAGWSDDESFASSAVVWRLGRPTALGVLPGTTSSQAWAINDGDQVTGRSDQTPFIWERGAMRALPTLQGGTGLGVAINNLGLIAGQADNGFGQSRAVIWIDRREPIQEPGIVWNFGPETGRLTPGEGGGAVLFNASTLQNFADSVRFSRTTRVTGINVYTSSSHLPFVGPQLRVRILADQNGLPGAPIAEFNVAPTNITYVGLFKTTAGQLSDVHRVRLDFPAVTFDARRTYWIGASGLGFDAGLYGVVRPGDGRMAAFSGETLVGLAPAGFGDMMFQLFSRPGQTR